jgi:Sec-independent protein translocase protein TatA
MADINVDDINDGLKKLADTFGISDAELSNFVKTIGKSNKEFKKSISDLEKEVNKGTKGYVEQQKLIDELNDSLKELGDTTNDIEKNAKKEELTKQRDNLANSALMKGTSEDVAAAFSKSSGIIVVGAAQFVKGLQANNSAAQLSADLFKGAIDIMAGGAKSIGSVTEKIGDKMLASASPLISGIGLVVAGAGMIVNASAQTAAAIAKFGVDVMQVEVEKTYKAFNSMSASGALFADGMTGMRTAAHQAGMTVELFAGVLKNQSENIAASGFGITEGAKRIGGALDNGGISMRQGLLNLGFGMEEQAELVAETMRTMRGSTAGPLRASNQQVAEQTQKYAENLRIIASITGEDAKKKMAQVQDEANQLSFQQKLSTKSAGEQADIMNAFGNMNTLQRKNFMDMVNFGGVINTEGAIAASLSGGLRDSVSEAYQNYLKGTLDDETMRSTNARQNGRMQKEALDQVGIGLAGAAGIPGVASDLAKSLMQMVNEVKSGTPEAIKAAEDNAKKQKETTDAFTQSVTGAEVAAMKLKVALEVALTDSIVMYAETSVLMLNTVVQSIDAIKLKINEWLAYTPPPNGEFGDDTSKVTARTSLITNTVLGPKMRGYGPIFGKSTSDQSVKSSPSSADKTSSAPSSGVLAFAKGGISSGSLSGYSATLHGTEAVIPLPDGKSVPVSLDSSSLNAVIQEQTSILSSILSSMDRGNQNTSGILQNSM